MQGKILFKVKFYLTLNTGLFIIIGTTFGGCTEPQSDLTKNLFNDYMKIIIKSAYGY